MQTSSNYGFKLPQSNDPVSIGDINYNFSAIDANLLAWIGSTIAQAIADSLDTTLSVSGKPADAKATGDSIAAVEAKLEPGTNHSGKVMAVNAAGNVVPTGFDNFLDATLTDNYKAAPASMVRYIMQTLTGRIDPGSSYANNIAYINTNGALAFTDAADQKIRMTGYTAPASRLSPVTDTDTLLTAISKLQGYINDLRNRVAALEENQEART